MAPEVIQSVPEAQEHSEDDDPKKGYDHHCDVWSLGKYNNDWIELGYGWREARVFHEYSFM